MVFRKLSTKGDIIVKLVSVGRNNTPLKKFCFVKQDGFNQIVQDFNHIRSKYQFFNAETLSNLMIVQQIKEMNKHGHKK